jgi:hypothetical protein
VGGSTAAEPCSSTGETTLGFVVGLQFTRDLALLGGVELRQCFTDSSDGLIRFEFGGGTPRLIAGVHVRPLEASATQHDADMFGLEAGFSFNLDDDVGLHLAFSIGSKAKFMSLQARPTLKTFNDQPVWSVIAGLAPWSLGDPVTNVRPTGAPALP